MNGLDYDLKERLFRSLFILALSLSALKRLVLEKVNSMNYCRRTHGVPALFSFFVPGLGQLVKGQILKALFIWIAFAVTGALHIIGTGFLIWTIIWIWQLYDAYNA